MSTLALRQADILRFLQGGNSRYLVLGVNLLLVVWIAVKLASLTWGLVSPDGTAPAAALPPPASQEQRNADRRLVSQLPGWHLMGVATVTSAPVQATAVPEDAPDTRLQMTLRGALASDEPGGGRAIIADSRGKEDQYSIGDTLPGNAELSQIYPDRVILKRNGRFETLRLPIDSAPAGVGARRVLPRAQNTARSPQQRLADVRQQLRQDARSVTGLLRAAVHTDDAGNMLGYRISPGRDPALFGELGLMDGDIVTRVNDMSLSDPANGGKALQVLQSGEPVSVTLIRDGQEQVVSLDGL